ncbi:LOW QUALITY PROTEIN: WD repeat-containing protein 54-like [Ruditapes philippinarum]|uniref:LOW QUALITY PROTEIN: WD repeat-containing protein 54-like n=1 Tax=Ruditapes philippinarum TaxID=129788 RepID=UPI00295BDAA1|nr:LOW QUALITY PROTEIN: WD repeat-containing protein 54-like [Ruditapes philippinarum]
MFKKSKPLALKSSASMICNNLTVLNNADRGSLNYASVHKYLINMVSTSTDGSQVTHKQVICKEPSASQQSSSMIMQTKWVHLGNGRTILVLTSLKGIQMFEYDGSSMIYWHATCDASTDSNETSNFGRGIAAASESLVCVGTQQGAVLVFDVPVKGTNVSVTATCQGHTSAICDLASEGDVLVSADEDGNIIIWKTSGSSVQQTVKIPGNGDPCTSRYFWKGIIVAAFGNGQLCLYTTAGKLASTVNAHARWINAIDIAKESGMVVSVSEDSYARVWQLIPGNPPIIEFKFAEAVTDQQLVGAQFVHPAGRGFVVSGYDSSDLNFFVQ